MNILYPLSLLATLVLAQQTDIVVAAEVVVMATETLTASATETVNINVIAAKTVTTATTEVVVVEETNKVFFPDPNGQAPYKNGLTLDIFFSCNNRKGFIAKRNNGIYVENYEIPAGQSKPLIK